MNASSSYNSLLKSSRFRTSEVQRGRLADEALSDYGRVLYSPAFRRLQLKTQVFPLEDNASVRSRLTHSLEVSHIGHRLASSPEVMSVIPSGLQDAFSTFTKTACLCHDIGNPPFGHFGETAIQDWFKSRESQILVLVPSTESTRYSAELLPDFKNFDGNPQAFRLLTRLSRNNDRYGLNLTFTQLASNLKYTCLPSNTNPDISFCKKAGFFTTERNLLVAVRRELELADNARHPVSMLMEAADDIAYCMSDIEDAKEKGIISEPLFLKQFGELWDASGVSDATLSAVAAKKTLLEFKVAYSEAAIARASSVFASRHSDILSQSLKKPLLQTDSAMAAFQKCLRNFCIKNVYSSPDTERLELTGYRAVTDILSAFWPLVEATSDEFSAAEGNNTLLRRLKNMLPGKHKDAYVETVEDLRSFYSSYSQRTLELHARLHLITDFVSGMTDRYAIEVHKTLTGQGAGTRA